MARAMEAAPASESDAPSPYSIPTKSSTASGSESCSVLITHDKSRSADRYSLNGLLRVRLRSGDASGRAAADQPDGRGDKQHRQREQPAALDPLEWPEPAARLIPRPIRISVLGEVVLRAKERRQLVQVDLIWRHYGHEPLENGKHDLLHRGLAERRAALGPPLAEDPRGAGHGQVGGNQRRQVVLAQEDADRESEPGVDRQGGDDRGDDAADEHAGQGTDREGGQRPGGERDLAQVEQADIERGRLGKA